MCCELGNGFRNQLFGTKAKHKIKSAFTIHVSLKRRFDCFATTFPPAPEQKTHSPSCDPSDQQRVLLLPFPPAAQGTTASPGPSHGSLAALEMRDTGGWDQEQPVPAQVKGKPLTTEPRQPPTLSRGSARASPGTGAAAGAGSAHFLPCRSAG